MSRCRDLKKNVPYEFVFLSPAVSRMPCSSWMVFEMGTKWPHSCCFVGCCFPDLFKTARSIIYCSFLAFMWCIHTIVLTQSQLEKIRFILLYRSDFYIIVNQLKAFYTFARGMLTSLSVDEILLPSYVNLCNNFRGLLHKLCFICVHVEAKVSCCLLLSTQQGFGLGRYVCEKR